MGKFLHPILPDLVLVQHRLAILPDKGASSQKRFAYLQMRRAYLANNESGGMADWDDLKVFLAVARAESLSRAGQVLRIDPATAGRRVARLEEALG
ncbi:MAG: LysR family transcriptional regulator, partial [Allgaiera sp.]|nr:LysR family transcriptional regulator [Allgaiera sp.]